MGMGKFEIGLEDFPQHFLRDVVGSDANHSDSKLGQRLVTSCVVGGLVRMDMNTAVNFHCKSLGRAVEIENEFPEDMLPAKLQPSDPLSAQELPGPVL
jgi:hypothetical protein